MNESQVRECVEIENVTYDGVNIFTSADRIGNYIYVKLSKDKLNKKYNTVTTKLSKNVIFTFDNGFTLSDGYRIIMNPAQNN